MVSWNLVDIGSGDGLAPVSHHTIIRTNVDLFN